jgi:hypothetical protein
MSDPQLCLWIRKLKTGQQDTDHFVTVAVQSDRPAYKAWIGREGV